MLIFLSATLHARDKYGNEFENYYARKIILNLELFIQPHYLEKGNIFCFKKKKLKLAPMAMNPTRKIVLYKNFQENKPKKKKNQRNACV